MPETLQQHTPQASAAPTRVARIVTEVTAPTVLVGILLLLQPLLTPSVTWLQGILAALFTVGLPFAGILVLKHRGKVSDHHIGVRSQRAPILGASAASMLIGALVLVLLDAPAELFGEIGGVFIGMMLCLVANLVWKLSVHSAVAAYVGLALLAPVPELGAALALLLASATGWSRIKLGAHTPTQVLAGHAAGCLAFAAALLLP
ncbi:phosphatidic acid phosphatase [Arthrobacter sp. zg-Y20]|uniref:phosphatase PAP2 family protein n=1 Tax=unclassified Arthrobacter TaxID=235627 RepID=UPI001D138708|nr:MULTISPECIES: phosphatase PAP2 family protein [unclassified Arthrobacter]MCC3276555.1 phosphatidic acid phosphatase [Arthrobacter sp. zg-Y20]MDK1316715.1 phosphatidic acid phosphatase [Arthrobacter sp. zg.Y20]WIB06862.1 phosphatidic acid phosphatase [Arthrobacter sp. zg-Y20]